MSVAAPLRHQTGGAVWSGDDLAAAQWSMRLPAALAAAPAPVTGALEAIPELAPPAAGEPWDWPSAAEAAFAQLAGDVDERLRAGPGFVVVRGFPIARWGPFAASALFARLMAGRGRLLAQNTDGQRLHLVRTRGGGAAREYGSRGSGELLYHTDQAAAPPEELPTSLGLLCLQPAATGGVTRLASARWLLNGLLGRDPALAEALQHPVPFARDADGVSAAAPVDAVPIDAATGGEIRMRFNRYFMEVGARATGRALPPVVVAALDAIDELLAQPGAAHEVLLGSGDALVADNGLVLHNRSSYTDGVGQMRCLVRCWAHRSGQ